MKEFVRRSTQLEFYEFDDMAVDGEQPEREGSVPPSVEGAGEGWEEDEEEDGQLESTSRRKTDYELLMDTSGGET